ncbi:MULTISPECIES: immunity 52 family protein [unclassified Corallococcus]|uniref:immunity 52 family protein n=1 Tax=unclassified Corallococcus TaxID=2685029 RepID=UPI001A8C7A00|nr:MULTISPECIES: immunity 52 family protein [unclassified Corallococcus]MBN9684149.1 immunity 52 family protein [Corallococcus sp. NCSPR001]WAS84361.1 immunity 52 family protein [Corallococcus sp. NCRR]
MNEKYYLGAYWPGRVEPVESYARRAEAFFRLLAPAEPTFNRWFEKAGSRADALKHPLVPNEESLLKLFSTKYRRDQVGVSFSAWNGEPDGASTGVRLACGSTSQLLGDLCVMELPTGGEVRARVLTASVLSQTLRAAALAWDPEWGIATSTAHRDRVSEFAVPGTFVGWVTYLSRRVGTVPLLPSPVHIERVEDKGTLIVMCPERFTVSNPEHIVLAEQVHDELNRAGLLKPIQPQG